MYKSVKISFASLAILTACYSCGLKNDKLAPVAANALKPAVITEQVGYDTDDPAIWIHPTDSSLSLIIGTDKETNGALYAFDLNGKIVRKSETLQRPNNVDIVQGFMVNGTPMDIAVTTERETNKIRIFSLPDLKAIDNGGIAVFENEQDRSPMGVALYTRPTDKAVFAIVGRKTGPSDGYLWQYQLEGNADGTISAKKIRAFGQYSGKKEIEAIAVDNELGYVYYSDEKVGVRKYNADPNDSNNQQLVLFADSGFVSDHEGIAIYKQTDSTGYILVSNQQNNSVMIYPREGSNNNKHLHPLLVEIPISAIECDGLEVSPLALSDKFPKGVLVAMSNGKVFHYYDWRDIQAQIVKK